MSETMTLPLPVPASAGPRRALTMLTALALVAGSVPSPARAAKVERGPVDNPYVGATAYLNPEWSVRAHAEPGGAAVADQPTAVWLDRIAAIDGTPGRMGLRGHLNTALAQGADLVQLTLYNLPGRDCDRRVSYGELAIDELDRYRSEFVDPIVAILADPSYAGLRIVTVVEPNSLPNLVTHTSPRPAATAGCDRVKAQGSHLAGIGYALARLATVPNVYAYLDASHHGQLGWSTDGAATAALLHQAASTAGSTPSAVHGFTVNVANYSVLREPYLDADDVVNGQPVRDTAWIAGNAYVDELPYAQQLRQLLVASGFSVRVGMLVDTSRNGWGGPARPTGPGPSTSAEEYVEAGRTDRRGYLGNWCNQVGAGLGVRPVAAPEAGIDAYAWIKPPGESDGASDVLGANRPYEPMCDPTYRPHLFPTVTSGAMQNAPPVGEWFPAHFRQLLANAWPPL
ncbi:glycoside hydrolase family 6 protein [Plantactinospora sp. KLBMP9567]|uniref:glycoside hydrolase family 6 protein n=1 Tax=Plantactinospora sp. KLBMP9567 TaxID=3085900 RepID=UPI002980F9FC|nr:glycoside hydrolase family 6 protein [Plantactinospora sp. KLBMP9567]MDW5325311.1 glycoside hydrolase family 6 protein [Plantactinospora sp. KLBMP9567]